MSTPGFWNRRNSWVPNAKGVLDNACNTRGNPDNAGNTSAKGIPDNAGNRSANGIPDNAGNKSANGIPDNAGSRSAKGLESSWSDYREGPANWQGCLARLAGKPKPQGIQIWEP